MPQADGLGEALAADLLQGARQAVDESRRNGGVVKVGRPALHRTGAGNDNSIMSSTLAMPPTAMIGMRLCFRNVPDDSQDQRLDGRAAEAAVPFPKIGAAVSNRRPFPKRC